MAIVGAEGRRNGSVGLLDCWPRQSIAQARGIRVLLSLKGDVLHGALHMDAAAVADLGRGI
jgi:hypothetical protein